MESFKNELKQVLRRLGRAPLFTAITLITLAAGVGANTVVFSVLEGVLLKPLPYPKPDELIGVWLTAPGIQLKEFELSPSDYFIFREQNRTLQDIGLYAGDSVSVTGVAEPEQVTALRVTDGTLPLLGTLPVLGRTFTKQDDSPGAPETAMLTYGYWRRKFGGDASVVGRNILVDGKSRQIIGVLPQRFHFLDREDPALIMPFQFDRNKTHLGNFSYESLARLKPGATIDQVNADVARMLPVVMSSFPTPPGFSIKLFEDAHIGPNVRPLKRDVVGDVGSVLLFTLLISLLASILFGSIPIFKYAGVRLSTGIREGGRALSQSKEQHRARSVLVVVQVALALVLLICSGLMIRTFRALTNVNPGFFGPASLQTFRISIPSTMVKENEQVVRTEEEILHRLAAIPGVGSAGIVSVLPMTFRGWHDPVFIENRTYAEGELPPLRTFRFVSPEYLDTVGTPLVAGRKITWNDTYKKIPVAMVSENVARELWHDPAAALGKRIRVASKDDWREIVGVVGDVHDEGVSKPATTIVYWPLLMDHFESDDSMSMREVAFVIRSSRTGSQSFLNEVRQAVWSLNPNLPLADVHPMDFFYKRSMARTSFTLIMLGVAGCMALLLGVVGIYGVIAYSVSQRTREIGIRMALGAQHQTLTGMFVRHGLSLTAIGIACGLVVAIIVMRLMSSLLFKVSPVDPVAYGAASLGLVATAFLASYLPSRRASAVDPVEALRAE